ncbi:MAG: hypothetical protein R2849_10600 [Thermomicrobiales bacterium]
MMFHIQEHELAAIWFLKNNPEWKDWVPLLDIAEKVQADLDQESIPGE